MGCIKNSIIYKIVIKFINILQSLIKNSLIFKTLTKEVDKEYQYNDSFFLKTMYGIINIFRKMIYGLKIDKILKDSIFINTYLWLLLTIVLLPFLSTTKILILFAITFLTFILKIAYDKDFKFKYTPVSFWIVLFLIVYVFCAVISVDPRSSLKTALAISCGIVSIIVMLNSIKDKKQIKILIYCFCIVGLIVSIYGIYQFASIKFFGSITVDKTIFENIKTRVTSTFDNPNVLGEYLLLVIPLTISIFFASKGILKKIAIGCVFCVMGICLALTYSRGCYLGLIFGLAVFVLLLNFKFIILFIGGIMLIPFALPKTIINRFLSIGNFTDSSTQYRLSIWKASINMIKDYWYRPIGQGNIAFNKLYPLYSYNTANAEHTHCLFLQIIIETGLLGFIVFAILLLKFFQYIFSGIKKCVNFGDKAYLIGLVSGLSGFLIQSIFDNTLYNLRVGIIFWLYIGIAVTYRKLIKNNENDE